MAYLESIDVKDKPAKIVFLNQMAGNLGATHNIEFIIEMAGALKDERNIHFLIIGEGAKWQLVEKAIEQEKLDNITLLPFQSEEVLPYSMATGDIAIVSMQPGSEGLMVPSKAFCNSSPGYVIC